MKRGFALFLAALILAGGLVFGLSRLFRSGDSTLDRGGPAAPTARDATPALPEAPPPVAPGDLLVAGRVVGPDGAGLSDAVVVLRAPAETAPVSITFPTGTLAGPGRMTENASPAMAEAGRIRSVGDGRFEVRGDSAGPFLVTARAEGYAAVAVGSVKRGTTDLRLELGAAGSVAGRVVDDAGAALPDVEVTGGKFANCRSGADGRFLLTGVAVGPSVSVGASAAGYDGAAASVTVAAGGTAELPDPLVLTARTGLAGRVFDPDGRPLAGVVVLVYGEAGIFSMRTPPATTGAGGRWFVASPPKDATKVRVGFRHREYRTKEIQVALVAGRRTVAPDVRLEPGGVIEGRIRDDAGTPIEGAEVAALRPEDAMNPIAILASRFVGGPSPGSDENGAYRVAGLETGRYTLSVRAPGHRPGRREGVEVRVGSTTTADIVLARGNTVSGIVTDPTGKPFAGASIHVDDPGDAAPGTMDVSVTLSLDSEPPAATTDEAGRFSVSGLSDEKVTITASADGFCPGTAEDVSPDATDVVVRLLQGGSISGVVLADDTGKPLKGASLSASSDDGQSGRGTSGDDGTFRISGLAPGSFQLVASADDRGTVTRKGIEVKEGGETGGIEIRLARGERLAVLVVGAADGRPVKGAAVSASGGSGAVMTDENGRAELRSLLPGTCSISVRAEGFAAFDREGVTVPSPEGVRVELAAGGTIRGVVLDARGDPIEGRMVALGDGGNQFGRDSVTTDAAGEFHFEHVAPGVRTVLLVNGNLLGASGAALGLTTKQVTVKEGEESRVQFGGPSAKTAHLTGRVLDRDGPVAGKMLLLLPLEAEGGMMAGFKMATTGKDGGFDLSDLAPGRYTVLVGEMGHPDFAAAASLTIGSGGELQKDIELARGELTGQVFRAADGKPVSGARVALLDRAALSGPLRSAGQVIGTFLGQAQTDEKGAFHLGHVPPGDHLLLASADGLALGIVESVRVAEGEASPIRVDLGVGRRLTVAVEGPNGLPLPGAVVGLYTATGAWLPIGEDMSLTTDETGKAETRLPAGSFRVTAATDETAPGSAAVTMNADREVHIRLSAGGRVTVAVRRDGKPLAGAQVTAFGPDGNEVVRPPDQLTLMGGFPPSRTREDGTLEVAHLPSGAVRILVTAPDGRTGDATVTVPDGGAVSADVEIR